MNPFYIISTSGPDVDRAVLKKKFGEFTVLISNPEVLLKRIRRAWQQHECTLNGDVELVGVAYNKDESVTPNKYLCSPPEYTYSQKPRIFSDEKEFRYTLKCSFDANRKSENHITLNVGDCTDICRIL